MKRIFLSLIVTLLLIGGCSLKIPYTLHPAYHERIPMTIAVAVLGDLQGREIVERIVSERLKEKGYTPFPIEDKGIGDPRMLLRAGAINADALMVVEIDEWGRKGWVFYLTYKVGLKFTMYSKTGEILWSSHNEVSHRTVDIEGDMIKLARYRPFDPYVERVVDLSFSTLPDHP